MESGEVTEEIIQSVAEALIYLGRPMVEAYNQMTKTIADLLFYYVSTGDTKEIPNGWQGSVFVMPFYGEPVVVAIAGQLANPKVI